MSTMIELHTGRLRLRPLRPADADSFFPAFHDGENTRYWHTGPHADASRTRAMFEDMLSRDANAWWVLEADRDGDVGLVGFLGNTRPGAYAGFGYFVRRHCWRRGYAFQASRTALEWGFAKAGVAGVELWIHRDNRASRQLAHALGFTGRGVFPQLYPGRSEAEDTLVFGMTADEWAGTGSASKGPSPYTVEPLLPVRDVAASVAFYRDLLGFRVDVVLGDPPSHAIVTCGTWSAPRVRVHLYLHEEKGCIVPNALYFTIGRALDSLCTELERRGVVISEPQTTKPWQLREFEAVDRDGHRLRFGAPDRST